MALSASACSIDSAESDPTRKLIVWEHWSRSSADDVGVPAGPVQRDGHGNDRLAPAFKVVEELVQQLLWPRQPVAQSAPRQVVGQSRAQCG